ncbi:SRPBCC family protein [Aquimarina gracilis]|uniref:SRPBCC family protein n=1 Tax=Aquimarina gracilis TaxID=874422 RepID=A0ABU5ZUK1_9FLAO|nr:SRPBCC family protein [Aquimarina gracilis]MEB3345762.1 SRPBCC family protein [Aquimarina gracilis]
MKYVKYLLGFIVLLILIFFGSGLLTPSVYYESEIIVNKSAKESWAVMSDESKLPQWIKGFKKTELISGTKNSVGAVSKIYIDDNGQEMTMQETIKEIKPNALMSMKFTMDFMDMDYEMHMKENNGKTTINSKSTTVGNGLFAKSIVSFMRGSMKSQEDENLQSLKKVIEENTTDYFQNPKTVGTEEEKN